MIYLEKVHMYTVSPSPKKGCGKVAKRRALLARCNMSKRHFQHSETRAPFKMAHDIRMGIRGATSKMC